MSGTEFGDCLFKSFRERPITSTFDVTSAFDEENDESKLGQFSIAIFNKNVDVVFT